MDSFDLIAIAPELVLITISCLLLVTSAFVKEAKADAEQDVFHAPRAASYVYLKLPVGSEVKHTDSITKVLEARVNKVLGTENGKKNPVVESTIANIAVGASDPMSGDRSTRSELGRIQVNFVEFEKRHGVSTMPYLEAIRKEMKGIPGAEITVTQESNGPPTEPPVNIEIQGEDFDKLIKTAVGLKNYLDAAQIPGIEELKMDVDLQNPELTLTIDRDRALSEGVSSAQVGMQIRTALFGKEVSKIKDGKVREGFCHCGICHDILLS